MLAALPVVALGLGGSALCLSIEDWSARELDDASIEAPFLSDPSWTRAAVSYTHLRAHET